VKDAFVNGYNEKLLFAWRANIDFQFVIDTYACAKYCVGYIFKAEGGVSKLLRAASDSARAGNLSIKEKLSKFSRTLINGSEISAQEATAFLLGMDFTRCSRTAIFINTSPPNERTRILKSQEQLEKMNENDDEIYGKGMIEHYTQRPPEMSDMCLSEFATMYDYKSQEPTSMFILLLYFYNFLYLYLFLFCFDITLIYFLGKKAVFVSLWDGGYMKKRDQRKILRFRSYGKIQDYENYCREQLMLFLPWRNENTDLLKINQIQKFEENIQVIIANSKPFYFDADVDEQMLQIMQDQQNMNSDAAEESEEEQDEAYLEESLFGNMEDNISTETDFFGRPNNKTQAENFLPPKQIDDDSYYKIMRSLNEKQRRFVLETLYKVKCSNTAFYSFLHGGAGVGKSHAITAVVQSTVRYYSKLKSRNPEEMCVLVSAFTGKAAFNVFGMTLHTTFRLPPTQKSGQADNLEDSSLNTLRSKLGGVKLFIIDEISMVSVRHLYDIDSRLRQVFATNQDFGGRSLMVVGHLRQLPPIGGSYIFSTISDIADNYLWQKFAIFELTEIMRQRGDMKFCKALNNMSEGCMDDEDIQIIRSRIITDNNQPPDNAIWLFKTNMQCLAHNDKVHLKLATAGAESIAIDKVQGNPMNITE